jgi:hypothetical protein
MSGSIAMGTNQITGLGAPTLAQDATTKNYVDTQDALKLDLAGGTMSGDIDMVANKVTTTYTPTNGPDLTNKTYVDGILGSATSAATSAAAAATSATNAASSATAASAAQTAAEAAYDQFDDRYLGAKASAPSVDNDGNPLLTGAIYWDTSTSNLYIWDGSVWSAAVFNTAGAMFGANNLSDVTSVSASQTNLGLGTTDTPTFAGVTAPLTGNVTGNVTGNLTGNVTGNVTGDLDGIVGGTTPAAGTFTTVSISGSASAGDLTVSGQSVVTPQAVAAIAGTTTLDFSTTNNFVVTMAASTTFSFSNVAAGQTGVIYVKQDATGGWSFTLPAIAKTPLGGAAIAQTTTANTISILSYTVLDSSNVLMNYIGDYA